MLFNVWVTTACNLCCDYCYEGTHMQGVNMDIDTAEQTLDYICSKINESKEEYSVVNYHGGEPLLNYKVIYYMTEQLKERLPNRKILFGLTTNGFLLDQEKSEYLINNFQYNLSISIDGTKEIHDMNRKTIQGKGTYEKVIENIQTILRKRKDTRARVTYTPETLGYLFKSIVNLVNIGFHNIVPVPNYSDMNWTDKHGKILEEEILKLYYRYGKQTDIYISLLTPDFHVAKGRCNAGIGEINIDCYGRIYPCTCMVSEEKYQLGSVQMPKEQDVIELLKESEKSETECKGCGLEHWCIGARCKLVNKMITGDFGLAPSFLCAETHALYRVYSRIGGK